MMNIQPFRTVAQSRRFRTGPVLSTGNSDTGAGGGVSLTATTPTTPTFGQQTFEQKATDPIVRIPSRLKASAPAFVPTTSNMPAVVQVSVSQSQSRDTTPGSSGHETTPTSIESGNKGQGMQLTVEQMRGKESPRKLLYMYQEMDGRERAVTVATHEEYTDANRGMNGYSGDRDNVTRSATISNSANNVHGGNGMQQAPLHGRAGQDGANNGYNGNHMQQTSSYGRGGQNGGAGYVQGGYPGPSQQQRGGGQVATTDVRYENRSSAGYNHHQKHHSVAHGKDRGYSNAKESTGVAYRYNAGLPGSASDGRITYNPNNNNVPDNNSMAVVQHSNDGHQYPVVNDTVYLGRHNFEMPSQEVMACRSELLRSLHWNECPRVEDMTDPKFLPFVACYSQSSPAVDNGVIILRNIPYETTRSECIAMLGRNSRLLSDVYEPVHIIMDRVTSKTLDAFCEVDSLHAALNLAAKFGGKEENGRQENSRHARLGNRTVEVEVSSQASLMQALFPNAARGVQWHGAQPQPTLNAKDPWDNFKGFVTEEEMSMLAKHVEVPQRSTFSRACPERPYECMISTLRKMPWYKAQYITIKQRQSVYEACMKMIAVLDNKLNPREGFPVTERLTRQLFNRLVNSAMLCPGFSVVQKHNIAVLARLSEDKVRGFNQPRFPDSWRHQWTLIPKPGMPIDLLEWYIAVIRTETNRVVQNLDISQKMPLQQLMERVDGYWGYFWAEANFPVGPDFDNMSLEECNAIEWRAIGAILTRAVKGGAIPPSYTIGSNHLDSSAPRQIGY